MVFQIKDKYLSYIPITLIVRSIKNHVTELYVSRFTYSHKGLKDRWILVYFKTKDTGKKNRNSHKGLFTQREYFVAASIIFISVFCFLTKKLALRILYYTLSELLQFCRELKEITNVGERVR